MLILKEEQKIADTPIAIMNPKLILQKEEAEPRDPKSFEMENWP